MSFSVRVWISTPLNANVLRSLPEAISLRETHGRPLSLNVVPLCAAAVGEASSEDKHKAQKTFLGVRTSPIKMKTSGARRAPGTIKKTKPAKVKAPLIKPGNRCDPSQRHPCNREEQHTLLPHLALHGIPA